MSWNSKTIHPLISDGHVKVIKVVRKGAVKQLYRGYYYREFSYELNKEYNTKTTIKKELSIKVRAYGYGPTEYTYYGEEGFHCYSDECKLQLSFENSRITLLVFQKDKSVFFDAYYEVDPKELEVLEGFIPKGGKYYVNENGAIISDSIVLTKVNKTIHRNLLQLQRFTVLNDIFDVNGNFKVHIDLLHCDKNNTVYKTLFDEKGNITKREEAYTFIRQNKGTCNQISDVVRYYYATDLNSACQDINAEQCYKEYTKICGIK